ncbi:MAG: tetratricopeptide repeat protein, partial [Myxococcales bacterium]|nr:tetratricopeptide repeat protein [Myxococcales bacterium]
MSERRESGGLGPHDEQVAEWARALSEDPTSPVFYDLARALLARRAPKRAALVLKGALNHHPARDDARLLLGEALLASGRGRACTREMARILSRHPEHLEALKLLARALRFEGQRDEARVILERARELAPADTEVAGMLADPGPPGISVRERDGRVTALVDDESEILEPTGSFGSSVRFLTDPLAEPTVRDVPLSLEEARRPVDPPEVFTSSHRVPEVGTSSEEDDAEEAEDATRPMSMPPFEEMMAAELSAMLFDDADVVPSVQVSPSLALEAARLAEAGLIEAPRAARLPAAPLGLRR